MIMAGLLGQPTQTLWEYKPEGRLRHRPISFPNVGLFQSGGVTLYHYKKPSQFGWRRVFGYRFGEGGAVVMSLLASHPSGPGS